MGAIILNGAIIGDNCLVGAGALVTEGKVFEPGSLIVGTPAKSVRTLESCAVAGNARSAADYVDKKNRYATGLRLKN